VARQFFAGLATTIAFVVVIALLLMGIFLVVNIIGGPIGG
jgi:hypothetical protein